MAARPDKPDSRVSVARYQLGKLTPAPGKEQREPDDPDVAGQTTMDQRAQYVEISIQQAIRRGDFDDLPGAGRPLAGLSDVHDPDWWIRRKIEREKLTGLGPPALTLRTENAALDGRLDAMNSEADIRAALEEFNRRVVEARRQLLGGLPVITPTRDIDEELRSWRRRRAERLRAAVEEQERKTAEGVKRRREGSLRARLFRRRKSG